MSTVTPAGSVPRKRLERFARFEPLLEDHLALGILACQLKHPLGQIDRNRRAGRHVVQWLGLLLRCTLAHGLALAVVGF